MGLSNILWGDGGMGLLLFHNQYCTLYMKHRMGALMGSYFISTLHKKVIHLQRLDNAWLCSCFLKFHKVQYVQYPAITVMKLALLLKFCKKSLVSLYLLDMGWISPCYCYGPAHTLQFGISSNHGWYNNEDPNPFSTLGDWNGPCFKMCKKFSVSLYFLNIDWISPCYCYGPDRAL